MSEGLTNIIYYLGLYFIVFLIRFFKVSKEGTPKENTIYIALEIVYSSAGVIILLLQQQPNLVPALLIMYVVLLLCSSYLDSMAEKFSRKLKITAHIIIILIIITGTVYSFKYVLYKQNQTYKVMIPYTDFSLVRHLGLNFSDYKLSYTTTLEGKNEHEAAKKAEKYFWEDNATNPFKGKNNIEKKSLIKIDKTNILVTRIEKQS